MPLTEGTLIEILETNSRIRKMKWNFFNNRLTLRPLEDKCKKTLFRHNLFASLRKRNLYILLEGERILVKSLKIPRVPKKIIDYTIINELKYSLVNYEDVAYFYNILDVNETWIEAVVYCINSTSLDILKNEITRYRLKSVNLIQFCIIEYIKDMVDTFRYTVIVSLNSCLYMMICKGKKIYVNEVVKFDNKEEEIERFEILLQSIKRFLYDYFDDVIISEKIYLCNLDEDIMDTINTQIKTISIKFSEEEILAYCYGSKKRGDYGK